MDWNLDPPLILLGGVFIINLTNSLNVVLFSSPLTFTLFTQVYTREALGWTGQPEGLIFLLHWLSWAPGSLYRSDLLKLQDEHGTWGPIKV